MGRRDSERHRRLTSGEFLYHLPCESSARQPESFGTVWLTFVMCNDPTVIAHEIERWDIAGFHKLLGARRLAFQFFFRVISVAMALKSKLEPR